MSKLLVNNHLLVDNLKLVIFDKDGTLIDIHHYWTSMIRLRSELIIEKWFDPQDPDRHKLNLMSLMGVNLKTQKLKQNGPVGVKPREFIVAIVSKYVSENSTIVSREEIELIFKDVDKISEKNLLPFLKLLPGVEEIIHQMHRKGVIMAIASTDITSRVKKAMHHLSLEAFFSNIIGGDLVEKTKPHPDLALKILRETNIDAKNTVVIGDHPVDILMAESANIEFSIGVLNGISKVENFNQCKCQLVDSFHSLKIV